jgi:hypothetical protein
LGAHSPRNVRPKGTGPESRTAKPDAHNNYDYENQWPAFARMCELGVRRFTLMQLRGMSAQIQSRCAVQDVKLSKQNRWAKRRMPNAYQ